MTSPSIASTKTEAREIHASGGRIRRVVLDTELKRRVYRDRARLRQRDGSVSLVATREVASRHGLPVVKGRIAFPDLRLEDLIREAGEIGE